MIRFPVKVNNMSAEIRSQKNFRSGYLHARPLQVVPFPVQGEEWPFPAHVAISVGKRNPPQSRHLEGGGHRRAQPQGLRNGPPHLHTGTPDSTCTY